MPTPGVKSVSGSQVASVFRGSQSTTSSAFDFTDQMKMSEDKKTKTGRRLGHRRPRLTER